MKFEDFINTTPTELQELIEKCKLVHQDAMYHPEAPNDKVPHNVYKHINIVYNRALQTNDKDLIIAAFLHDLGKIETTKPSLKKQNSWNALDHESISVKIAEHHKQWIEDSGANFSNVIEIIQQHMRMKFFNEMKRKKQEVVKSNPLFNKFIKFLELDNMKTLSEDECNI